LSDDYRIKRLVESLDIYKGSLLDIGCGGGILTESLAHYYPKMKIFGCDISKNAIRYAKKYGHDKVRYSSYDGVILPYKKNTFDACTCFDVMEHIPDEKNFLEEVKRVLKPGGKFFLVVPCEAEKFTFTWFFQKVNIFSDLTYYHWGHVHPEFTHEGIISLLSTYGLRVEKKTYSEHAVYQIMNLVIYFIPKALMDLVLGSKKAVQYTDREVFRTKRKSIKGFDIMLAVRYMWLKVYHAIGTCLTFETEVCKYVPYGAWKIHVLSMHTTK
jgi:2-polyprenyl-3-methyl-5-hydroxy-6-metoxy-1,4-benzoquinol methylase